MRLFCLAVALLALALVPARARDDAAFEVVKQHIDVDVNEDGSYVEVRDIAMRPLNSQGVQKLQQITLSFTEGYTSISIPSAYTLKANGKKIPLDQNDFLYGAGATSAPGFEDVRTVTAVFRNLEAGDQIVYTTVFKQLQPWFAAKFSTEYLFPRTEVSDDTEVRLTAPTGMQLKIDAVGVEGGMVQKGSSEALWEWHYRNALALPVETDAVDEDVVEPHVSISSFQSYAEAAKSYADKIHGKAETAPQIRTLAEQLTHGVADRREQAHILYDWVSTHISYVAIVLGAGGYIPHDANEVLQARFGDCKDHVMLLQAMLAAKGIDSSPALINALDEYQLSPAPTLYEFDHLITYVPEFNLFLDSTARYATFGTLPDNDAGKPVVLISNGAVMQTPVTRAAASTIRSVAHIKVAEDGSAEGTSRITATGAMAANLRALVESIPASGEDDYFRLMLGPGSSGALQRGDPAALSPSYSYDASYHVANFASIPGPGALRLSMAYKPFYFSAMLAGDLRHSRTRNFACASATAEETVTVELPAGLKLDAIPAPTEFEAWGVSLSIGYERLAANTIQQTVHVTMDRPEAVCSADSYNRFRSDLERMVGALNRQILYR